MNQLFLVSFPLAPKGTIDRLVGDRDEWKQKTRKETIRTS